MSLVWLGAQVDETKVAFLTVAVGGRREGAGSGRRWATLKAVYLRQGEIAHKTSCEGGGERVEKGWMLGKANEINLIIKKSHKMDWSHLEMPFVLSLFPSFLCYFHFTSPLFVVGRRCVFLLFLPALVSFGRGRKTGKEIYFFISDTSSREWRLITKQETNK